MGLILGLIGLIILFVILTIPVVLVERLCKSFAHRMRWDEENDFVHDPLTIAALLALFAADVLIFWLGGFIALPENNFAKASLEAIGVYTAGFAALILVYLFGKFLFRIAAASFTGLNSAIRGE